MGSFMGSVGDEPQHWLHAQHQTRQTGVGGNSPASKIHWLPFGTTKPLLPFRFGHSG